MLILLEQKILKKIYVSKYDTIHNKLEHLPSSPSQKVSQKTLGCGFYRNYLVVGFENTHMINVRGPKLTLGQINGPVLNNMNGYLMSSSYQNKELYSLVILNDGLKLYEFSQERGKNTTFKWRELEINKLLVNKKLKPFPDLKFIKRTLYYKLFRNECNK